MQLQTAGRSVDAVPNPGVQVDPHVVRIRGGIHRWGQPHEGPLVHRLLNRRTHRLRHHRARTEGVHRHRAGSRGGQRPVRIELKVDGIHAVADGKDLAVSDATTGRFLHHQIQAGCKFESQAGRGHRHGNRNLARIGHGAVLEINRVTERSTHVELAVAQIGQRQSRVVHRGLQSLGRNDSGTQLLGHFGRRVGRQDRYGKIPGLDAPIVVKLEDPRYDIHTVRDRQRVAIFDLVPGRRRDLIGRQPRHGDVVTGRLNSLQLRPAQIDRSRSQMRRRQAQVGGFDRGDQCVGDLRQRCSNCVEHGAVARGDSVTALIEFKANRNAARLTDVKVRRIQLCSGIRHVRQLHGQRRVAGENQGAVTWIDPLINIVAERARNDLPLVFTVHAAAEVPPLSDDMAGSILFKQRRILGRPIGHTGVTEIQFRPRHNDRELRLARVLVGLEPFAGQVLNRQQEVVRDPGNAGQARNEVDRLVRRRQEVDEQGVSATQGSGGVRERTAIDGVDNDLGKIGTRELTPRFERQANRAARNPRQRQAVPSWEAVQGQGGDMPRGVVQFDSALTDVLHGGQRQDRLRLDGGHGADANLVVVARDGKQDRHVGRRGDLPVAVVFKGADDAVVLDRERLAVGEPSARRSQAGRASRVQAVVAVGPGQHHDTPGSDRRPQHVARIVARQHQVLDGVRDRLGDRIRRIQGAKGDQLIGSRIRGPTRRIELELQHPLRRLQRIVVDLEHVAVVDRDTTGHGNRDGQDFRQQQPGRRSHERLAAEQQAGAVRQIHVVLDGATHEDQTIFQMLGIRQVQGNPRGNRGRDLLADFFVRVSIRERNHNIAGLRGAVPIQLEADLDRRRRLVVVFVIRNHEDFGRVGRVGYRPRNVAVVQSAGLRGDRGFVPLMDVDQASANVLQALQQSVQWCALDGRDDLIGHEVRSRRNGAGWQCHAHVARSDVRRGVRVEFKTPRRHRAAGVRKTDRKGLSVKHIGRIGIPRDRGNCQRENGGRLAQVARLRVQRITFRSA